jgi:protein involved in polysaccharide export with SLBB domain
MKDFRLIALLVLVGLPSNSAAQTRELPLREGDRILLKLWSDTVFADTARVQRGAVVVLPRVGAVSLAAVPISQVSDSVRSAYARLFRSLTVEVSPLRKITVVGEVRRPDVYFLDPNTLLRDAVGVAGGITEIGRENRIRVVRDSSSRLVKGWQTLLGEAATVQSGDVLIAEREPWLKRNALTVVSATGVLFSIYVTLRPE